MARSRGRRPAERRGRPAQARRPEGSVAGSTGRGERRVRERRRRATLDGGGPGGPKAAALGSRHARHPHARRVQLHARAQRLFRPARRAGGRAARAQAGGCGCLPRAGRLSRVGLVRAARQDGARARRRAPARGDAPGLRRARSHDRAPRHGGRPGTTAPTGSRHAGARHRGRARRRTCSGRSRRVRPARAPRDRAGGDPRRRRRTGWNLRGGHGRHGAADPRGRLATRPDRQLGRLLPHRPADRGSRARRRPQRRRRCARCRADRADRRGRPLRCLRRLARGAGDQGRASARHPRRHAGRQRRSGGPWLRQRLQPGRRAGRPHGRCSRPAPGG